MTAHHTVFHTLRVGQVEELTDDSVALTLEVPDDLREEFAFTAGQHLTILGPDGVRRSYSLASPPSSGVLRIGIKKLRGGAFSEGVLPLLKVGDPVAVMRPSGRFTVVPDATAARRYAAIAAGSGITPILSIITTLLEEEPDCFVTLIYANRTQRSIMFLGDVADLKDRFPARFQVLHVLSRERQDVELLSGRLDGSRLHALLDAWVRPDLVDDWYLCGPQQMVLDLRDALVDAGVAESAIHSELFHAEPVPRRPVVPAGDLVGGVSAVTIRLDGRESEFPLRPDGPPLLLAALEVRPDLPFACQGGVCGTCRARLVEGTVTMEANWALEPDEIAQGYVLTCQSHPTAPRVVLDYDG